MAALHILVHFLPKVLLNDGDLTIGLFWVVVLLQFRQELREKREGFVLGIGDQEREVD